MVIVYLGGGLAWVFPQHSACVLDEQAVERNGHGQEERVEIGRVEPFSDIGSSADHGQSAIGGRVVDVLHCPSPRLGAHSTAETDGSMPALAESIGERLQMCGTSGEHQALACSLECFEHMSDNQFVTLPVVDQFTVDRRHAAWLGRVCLSGTSEVRVM